MARLFSDYSLNQDNLNLSRLSAGYLDNEFLDNEYVTYKGIEYTDVFAVYWSEDSGRGGYDASAFAGPSISVGSNSISGTVTGYFEFIYHNGTYKELYGIQDVTVSAESIYSAALTYSTADDYKIIEDAFAGNDRFDLSNFGDTARGYTGNDKMYGNGGNDFRYGGKGKDQISGGSGNDMIDGGRGNDKIYADFGDDVIIGGSGIDWLFFNGDTAAYCDLYHGQSHNTGYGRDKVKGIENISGSKRGDTFHGTEDKNIIKGMGGNDAINGRSGDDILYGGNHNDLVNGGRGSDRIYGDKADDRLIGGPKNDKLFGGSGRDTLTGEAGQDQLFGGTGADTFIFHGTNESIQKRAKADVIIDFEQGRDVIDLSSMDASTKIRGADTFVFNGTTKFKTEKVGEIYYQKYNNPGSNNDFTMVYVDTDDDRGAEMSIKLQGLYDLTSDDFLL